jgi:hypothetical protein
MTAKIYCRERRKAECGEKRPRYRVVAVSGVDLKIYAKHMRLDELKQVAEQLGAELVLFETGRGDKRHRDEA